VVAWVSFSCMCQECMWESCHGLLPHACLHHKLCCSWCGMLVAAAQHRGHSDLCLQARSCRCSAEHEGHWLHTAGAQSLHVGCSSITCCQAQNPPVYIWHAWQVQDPCNHMHVVAHTKCKGNFVYPYEAWWCLPEKTHAHAEL
jgi:hypothetical protein